MCAFEYNDDYQTFPSFLIPFSTSRITQRESSSPPTASDSTKCHWYCCLCDFVEAGASGKIMNKRKETTTLYERSKTLETTKREINCGCATQQNRVPIIPVHQKQQGKPTERVTWVMGKPTINGNGVDNLSGKRFDGTPRLAFFLVERTCSFNDASLSWGTRASMLVCG